MNDLRGNPIARASSKAARVVRRLGWGLADQGVSSLTNFALGIVVARSVSPRQFGAFSIAFGIYLMGLGLSRAVTSEPLMVRFSAVSPRDWKAGARKATGTAVAVGLIGGSVCIVSGLVVPEGTLTSVLFALGACMPGLLLQDTWRYAFFAGGRGPAAVMNDVAWAVVLAGSLMALFATEHTSAGWFVLAWGGSGSIAALVGMWQASAVPNPGDTRAWLRDHRDLIPRFVGEFAVTVFSGQITFLLVGAVAGLATAGAIRAGQILLGPLNIIFMGVSLAGLPEAVRLLQTSRERLRRACAVLSVALGLAALSVGLVAMLLPEGAGRALLGDNWPLARSVVFPLSVGMACAGAILGAGIGLRALAAAKLSLRARLTLAPLALFAAVVGAATAGAWGVACGYAASYAIGMLIWWHAFRVGLKRYGAQTPPGDAERVEGHEARETGLGV